MAIQAEDETKKIKTSTGVDEAIRDANTNPDNTTVTDEDVEKARQQAGSLIEDTIGTAGVNQATQMDSKNLGAAGKNVSALFRKISGRNHTTSARSLVRYAPPPVRDEGTNVSDADHLERNQAMAQAAFEQVQSNIVREATRGTENGENTVIGVASDTNVYSEESVVMSETVTGKLTLHPSSSPKAREDGTYRVRRSKMLSVSGDYIHASSPAGHGHDQSKGWLNYENVLFNRLNQFGAIIPNQFVAPKRGRFWVRGFNPLGGVADPNVPAYRVARQVNGEQVLCQVYQAPANSQGIFDVVDLTPTEDSMIAAAIETAELLTCNKSKFTMGQCEQIAQLFAAAQKVVDDPNQVIEWPEFTDAQRSTLKVAAGIAPNGTSEDCYNNLEPLIEFMHYLQESEIMIAVPRLDVSGIKDTLKFHRGMEGLNPSYPYWRNVFHGDPNEPGVFGHPSMAAYAATKSSARGYDTMAKWIYTFRTFWTDIESYVAVIDDGAAKDYIMSQIKVQRDVIDRLHNMLGIGTINDKDSMTSAQIIFGGNSVDLILGFDPNDLFNYTVTGSDANSARITVWPACGYANVFTRTSATNAQTVVYNILPTWMQILQYAMNATPFRQRLLQYHPGGVRLAAGAPENVAQFFFNSANYAQISIDLEAPSWYSCYFLEALMCYKERVYSDKNQLSGYLRYMRAEKVFQVDSVLKDDLITLKEALDGLITDTAVHYSATANKPSDFEELHDGAVKENFDYLGRQQLAIMTQVDAGKLNDTTSTEVMVLQPTHFDQHVFNLTGYTAHANGHAYDGEDEDILETIEDIPDSLGYILSPDGNYAILSDGNASNPAPVIFTRDVTRHNGAKTVEMLQFDADAGPLGYEDNPAKAMYFDDSFVNLAPFDGYVLMYKRGNYAAFDEAEPNCTAFRNYFFAPVIKSKGKTRSLGGFAANAIPHNVSLMSTDALSPNVFYALTGDSPATVTSRTVPALNGAADIMRRPSLYGYERYVPAGYTALSYGTTVNTSRYGLVQGRQQDVRAAGITFQTATGSSGELQRTRIYSWRPIRLGNEQAMSIADARTQFGEQFGLDTNAPSNWQWYSMQNVETTNWDNFLDTAGEDGVLEVESYVEALQRGNFIACAALIVANPLRTAFAAEYPNAAYNGAQQAQFGCHMDFDDAILFDEYFDRYEHKALNSYFASPLYGPIANAVVNSETTWGYSLDITRSPETRKRTYRNDTRLFLTDKPVVRLNNNWNAYGMTAALFYEQYHTMMKSA